MRGIRRYAAFFALVIIAFSSTVSLACEEPPLPLRGMYLESDVIVVGKIGRAGKWTAGEKQADSEYQTFSRAFPITVEKVVKGDVKGKLAVNEDNYHFTGETDGVKAAAHPDDSVEFSELAKDTGRRLFFLKKGEDGGYTEIYHNRYEFAPQGKDLDTYVTRLGELADMYRNGEPAKETLVEWLVKMVESPLTRFEGAYELRSSFYDLKWKSEQEAEEAAEAAKVAKEGHAHSVKEEMAANEATTEEGEGHGEEGDHEEAYRSYGEADFAKILTADQKERIIRAALGVKFDYSKQKHKDAAEDDEGYVNPLNEGDSQLIDAALMTGDRRVIQMVMRQIPDLIIHQNYTAASYLEMIGEQMKNERLSKLVTKYMDVAYGDGAEMIELKETAYDMEAFEGNEAQRKAHLATLPAKSYGERRTELMTQIYASLNQLMAKK